MPTLVHENREDGDYESLVKKAATGDLINLCEARNESKDYRVCRRGILEYSEGRGFFLNGIIFRSYVGKCRNWFPYDTNDIIVMTDASIIWIHDEAGNLKTETVYKNGPMIECVPHIFTESVLADEKRTDHTLLIQKSSARRLFAKKPQFWRGDEFVKHVRAIHKGFPNVRRMGHAKGPVFVIGNEYQLKTLDGTSVIHTSARPGKDKLVCTRGVIHETDGSLVFNEDMKQVFWNGEYDDLYPTRLSCVIRKDNRFYMPATDIYSGEPIFLKELPADNVESHPDGLLIDYKDNYAVLVIK